ncbi:hypothetical protein LX36DRAFT_25608 [Colletotrichum falcatum]|nr:hypothetical protein LX36DRAFT_25608 [Colletotrichum falcatum]
MITGQSAAVCNCLVLSLELAYTTAELRRSTLLFSLLLLPRHLRPVTNSPYSVFSSHGLGVDSDGKLLCQQNNTHGVRSRLVVFVATEYCPLHFGYPWPVSFAPCSRGGNVIYRAAKLACSPLSCGLPTIHWPLGAVFAFARLTFLPRAAMHAIN